MNQSELVSAMMDFEDGQATEEDVIDLFQHLVNTGLAWRLQGSYGHMAHRLLQAGHITMPTTGAAHGI